MKGDTGVWPANFSGGWDGEAFPLSATSMQSNKAHD